jgi:hypothetical protein
LNIFPQPARYGCLHRSSPEIYVRRSQRNILLFIEHVDTTILNNYRPYHTVLNMNGSDHDVRRACRNNMANRTQPYPKTHRENYESMISYTRWVFSQWPTSDNNIVSKCSFVPAPQALLLPQPSHTTRPARYRPLQSAKEDTGDLQFSEQTLPNTTEATKKLALAHH